MTSGSPMSAWARARQSWRKPNVKRPEQCHPHGPQDPGTRAATARPEALLPARGARRRQDVSGLGPRWGRHVPMMPSRLGAEVVTSPPSDARPAIIGGGQLALERFGRTAERRPTRKLGGPSHPLKPPPDHADGVQGMGTIALVAYVACSCNIEKATGRTAVHGSCSRSPCLAVAARKASRPRELRQRACLTPDIAILPPRCLSPRRSRQTTATAGTAMPLLWHLSPRRNRQTAATAGTAMPPLWHLSLRRNRRATATAGPSVATQPPLRLPLEPPPPPTSSGGATASRIHR
jgi:hypothetical protein